MPPLAVIAIGGNSLIKDSAHQSLPDQMEPKIRAVIEYLERGGKAALITMPESITRALAGETGTWILPDGMPRPVHTAANVPLPKGQY